MISALLVSLLANQSDNAPETIDALQKRMAQDSRKLKTYRDSWLLTTTTPNSKVQMRILRSIDGPRCAVMALIDDRPILNLGSDGTTSYFAFHPNSLISYYKSGNAWINKPPAADIAKLVDGDFNINLEGAYDWIVRCKPELKIISNQDALMEGKPSRLVTGEARRPNSEGRVVLKLWFPKESYVMSRAEAIVTSETKQRFSFLAIRDRLDESAKLDPAEFLAPKELVDGYKEAAWNKIVPGFQN